MSATFYLRTKVCVLVIFQSLYFVILLSSGVNSIEETTAKVNITVGISNYTNFTECRPEKGSFLCKSKTECIPSNLACDGRKDCQDLSDEVKNCEKSCSSALCSHHCTPNVDPSKAGVCYCNKGFRISGRNKDNCVNLNECDTWDTCSQGCTDTVGSFNCTCMEGFLLAADNRTCIPKEQNVKIVFALKNSIRVWSMKDKKQTIISEGGQTVGVAVDVENKYVFWTEVADEKETIYRSKINGDNRVALIDTGLILPEGIAYDWITGNIYFTDSNRSHIVACNGDGKFCAVLIQGYMDKPREIALQPSQGLMFWTDWGKKAAIVRAGMDGSIPLPIVTKGLIWPNGLAVDHGKSRLYWMDADLDIIETSTFTGEDRRIIKSEGVDHPFSLDVFADTLYWTDWHFSNIQSCNKLTGENHTVLVKDTSAGNPNGLAIFHPAAQPKPTLNPCDSSGCSHICVLTPRNSSVCACPAGFLLDKNGRTCIDDKSKPKLVIAHANRLRAFRFNSIGRDVIVEVTLANLYKIGAMLYNPMNDTLILSDSVNKAIYEYNQRSKKLRVVTDAHIGTVRGMAIDVVGQNLYWVDSYRQRVEVMSMRTGARVTISHETQFPLDILVIPEKKYLFLALSYPRGGRILRMHMNGFKRTTIFHISGGEPMSLTYNTEMERIFWCDVIKNTIEHVTLDGRSQSTAIRGEGNPYSIVSLSNRVFWTDRHTQLLNSLTVHGSFSKQQPLFIGHSEDAQNKTLESYIHGDFLAKIAIMDKDISRYQTLIQQHDCGNDENPMCSHICLISEVDNVGTCLCPEGMQIGRNKKTCTMNATCEANEYQCKDKKCIHEEEQCDGFKDCSGGEDEEGCIIPATLPTAIRCPKSTDFLCVSDGTCVSNEEACDGFKDCPGGEDEIDCPVPDQKYCRKSDFVCESDNSCISRKWKCDGNYDCDDGSDEKNCPSIAATTTVKPAKNNRHRNKTIPTIEVDGVVDDDNNENNLELEGKVMSSEEDSSSGTTTAVIIILILILLALLLVIGFVLQKKRFHPKGLVRPYVQQLVKYVNQPAKRWRRTENGREKLPEENTYDDAYDCSCSTGAYGKGIYANPTYEEIDCLDSDTCETAKIITD